MFVLQAYSSDHFCFAALNVKTFFLTFFLLLNKCYFISIKYSLCILNIFNFQNSLPIIFFLLCIASNKNRPLDSIVTKLDFDATLNEEHDKNTERRYSEQGSALLELDVKVGLYIYIHTKIHIL